MIRDILLFNNPILRKKSEEVPEDDVGSVELNMLISDMTETMYAAPGYGLAANQVNVDLNLFVIDTTWKRDDPESRNPIVCINPEIISSENLKIFDEGCLSIPGVFAKVERYNNISLLYTDQYGIHQGRRFDGTDAHAIQHEMDHLNGRLFIDGLGPVVRQLLISKHKKYIKKRARMLKKLNRSDNT